MAVGGWDQSLTLLTAPQLTPLATTPLGGEVIPRSVLLVELEGVAYCMVGLGDGALHTWRLEPGGCGLTAVGQGPWVPVGAWLRDAAWCTQCCG